VVVPMKLETPVNVTTPADTV